MKTIPQVKPSSGIKRTIRQIRLVLNPVSILQQRNQQYGDFYLVPFKNAPPNLVTSNPSAVEDIFTLSNNKFEVGRGNRMLSFLVGDNSLLLLDGKAHKNRRRLLMPPFHGEALEKCSQQIIEITNRVISNWEINKPFKVRSTMQEITLRVILSAVFGIDSGERYDRLRESLTKLLDIFNTPVSSSFMFFSFLQKDWGKYSPWGRFLLLKEEIRQLIYAEIAERRELLKSQKIENPDIFSLLMLSKDENGEGMSDEELHDELLTLLFAGHETTASALSWIFYWIHYIPEVKDKLLFEINNVKENIGYKNINSLAYLNATVSETLRIYPIAAGTFGRILTEKATIMGHEFDSSTWLMISIYSLHHREDLYPNPEQFKPERFLQRDYSQYEYIPFGGGNRRCIGSALALLEMKLVTATVLQQFQLELVSKKPMLPVRRGLTIAPPSNFKMRVKGKVDE